MSCLIAPRIAILIGNCSMQEQPVLLGPKNPRPFILWPSESEREVTRMAGVTLTAVMCVFQVAETRNPTGFPRMTHPKTPLSITHSSTDIQRVSTVCNCIDMFYVPTLLLVNFLYWLRAFNHHLLYAPPICIHMATAKDMGCVEGVEKRRIG